MKLIEHLELKHEPVIYGIRNDVTGKWYIGSTADAHDRLVRHVSLLKTGHHHSKKLQSSFNKHGIQSFSVEILYRFTNSETAKEMLALEEKYIADYAGCINGYNILSVCKSPVSFSLPEEAKLKAAQSHYKSIISIDRISGEVEREFCSITEAAKYYSGSTSNISQVCKGKARYSYNKVFVYSEDFDPNKDYRVQHHAKGIKFSNEHKLKMSMGNHKCLAVDKYDLEGNFIESYYCRSDAERKNNLKKEYLRHHLNQPINGFIYRNKDIV